MEEEALERERDRVRVDSVVVSFMEMLSVARATRGKKKHIFLGSHPPRPNT